MIHDEDKLEFLTSGLRVCRIRNLMHRLLFLSEQSATLSTTDASPSGPLNVCLLGLYALNIATE